MEQLPNEILTKVLWYADEKSKRNLRQTCTELFDFIDYRNFVIYFARSKQLPKMVKVFSRYQKPISIKFTKTIGLKPKAINNLSKLTNITALSFDGPVNDQEIQKKMMGLNQLTNLQQLTFAYRNNYAGILTSLHNMTTLVSDSCSADFKASLGSKFSLLDVDIGEADICFIEAIQNITLLTSLKIGTCAISGYHSTLQVLAQASNLKSLQLMSMRDLLEFTTNPEAVAIGTLTNLEKLCLKHYTVTELEQCVGLTSLLIWNQTFPHWYSTTLSNLTNLKTLDISLVEEDQMGSLPDLDFLTVLSNLTDCRLRMRMHPDTLLNLLPQSLTSLELVEMFHLKLSGISRLINLNNLIFRNITFQSDFNSDRCAEANMHLLTDLVNLTYLELSNSTSIGDNSDLTCITCLTNLKVFKARTWYTLSDFVNIDYSQLPNLECLCVPVISNTTLQNLSECSRLTKLEAKDKFLGSTYGLKKLPLRVLCVHSETDDEFWQHLVYLTSLESLRVGLENSSKSKIIQSQEAKIASLTILKHLTTLEFQRSSCVSLKCITRLTQLQRFVPGPGLPIEYYEQCLNLRKTMPYLHLVTFYFSNDRPDDGWDELSEKLKLVNYSK